MRAMRAVFFKDTDERWEAQCLEYDICAAAGSLSDLPDALAEALTSHVTICDVEGIKPFENLPKAPARFWKMYDDASGTYEPRRKPKLPRQPRLTRKVAPTTYAVACG